ncbi:complex I 24 kDa subunit family protein [Halarsenatibacter silvermanii]|uniref:NADH-quinone oxidoreductase subunit E n=1 Tax=Halarsenatibacter silvermanii TaxID=321763 RepID=A0A1G9KKL4_9FIRM|nr:NAD(P)H-dependent oxidoreductase subunit E [Halarsenatibacter silvermanii]SDL50067.1 NADH-quinone oxidoreductase subunit E [Halarsenatibacter silvermanii]
MDLELERVDEIIEKNRSEHKTQEKSPLIPVLQDIQTIYGWLPEQALVRASRKLNVPSIELYGVASFYEQFRLKPLGDYHIVVCTGTACHVRGAPLLMSELERNLGIAEGEVTPDQKFSLEGARCVGTCAVAPVIIVNGEYHGNMDKKKLGQLIEELKEGGE